MTGSLLSTTGAVAGLWTEGSLIPPGRWSWTQPPSPPYRGRRDHDRPSCNSANCSGFPALSSGISVGGGEGISVSPSGPGSPRCASLLLAQGVPARVVMEVLGHSQISMTLDTYSHVGADLLGDATKAMNASIRPAWKPDGYKNGYSGARGTRPGRVVGATSEIGSRAGAEGFEPSNGGSKVLAGVLSSCIAVRQAPPSFWRQNGYRRRPPDWQPESVLQ